jgi:hypothetical protein
VKNFTELKGSVIFAYPQFKKTNGSDKGSASGYTTHIPDQTRSINSDPNLNHKIVKETLSGISWLPVLNKIISDSQQEGKDPVRNWISKVISEDTTYHYTKSILVIDSTWNMYRDDRIVRWLFAIQIYTNEFSWKQKIFGGGFNFLNWYGYYFLKDKTKSDWPHNPFLAILLYSGIIGLLIYCYSIYKVFSYYIKYINEYSLLFIFFLLTFFFSFFSGSSPFDPPVMGFFFMLPFFIHSIHKKENVHINLKITE